jgi:hypothetical protein
MNPGTIETAEATEERREEYEGLDPLPEALSAISAASALPCSSGDGRSQGLQQSQAAAFQLARR